MNQPEIEITPIDRKIVSVFVLIIVAVISVAFFVQIYTDYMWFLSLGFGNYFIKLIIYRLEIFGLFLSITTAILVLNRFAMYLASKEFLGEPFRIPLSIFVLISITISYGFSTKWLDFVFFTHGQKFNLSDPIFNLDVSFYVFRLPFIKDVLALILVSVIISIIISIFYYAFIFRWVKSWEELKDLFPNAGYIHFSILFAAIMIIAGIFLFISRYDLLYSQHGVVSGANYTDVNVRIPALLLMSFFSFFIAVLSIYYGFKRDISLTSLAITIFIIALLVALVVIPMAVQKIRVDPNELSLEEQYIKHSIDFTRYAYGLDRVSKNLYPVSGNLTIGDIERNSGIIENIRLWDHRPLLSVYRQKQQIRTYYYINDVDVDRYYIDGKYTQIMISARELLPSLLQPTAQTWVNRHLIYTHGYGVIASPVNTVSEEGAPELILYDIPPKGKISIERPEMYFGEVMGDYVVVKTLQKEFDYPSGEGNIFAVYNGTGGVTIDSYWKKLLFSLRFGDFNLLLTNYLTEESRILMHRNIKERVNAIAPFFIYDDDPYIAIIDGRIYWIIDAYTLLDNFPYSAKTSFSTFLNYIRNSVKIFIDAYNGSIRFYIVEEEPITLTLKSAFPELFISGDEMSDEERQHIRYPVDLFKIQAAVYSVYHMDEPRTFYNKEDVWEIPSELFEDTEVKMEPYYVIITISDGPEFILMLPFTPKGRDNIISWMAARCDKNYGELILYEFPKGTLVYGPMQIEARVDQDPSISQIFTLWGQVGSRVTRGNLLVIPIDNSIIYVEPVYLRAENAEIPELRGVIVAYEDTLTMQPGIMQSIRVVFGEAVKEEPVTAAEDLPSLVEKSLELYEKAIEEIKSGNWSGFGDYLNRLGEVLRKLNSTLD